MTSAPALTLHDCEVREETVYNCQIRYAVKFSSVVPLVTLSSDKISHLGMWEIIKYISIIFGHLIDKLIHL